ncbi:MAG TPA: hypothetical protein VLZ03_00775 [Thermodesulfobacteriota bacterium]|nr:hypothetical protein [Thermodesulfobacteriota bacterium]
MLKSRGARYLCSSFCSISSLSTFSRWRPSQEWEEDDRWEVVAPDLRLDRSAAADLIDCRVTLSDNGPIRSSLFETFLKLRETPASSIKAG